MKPTNDFAASILQAADLVQRSQWRQAEELLAQVLAANPGEPDGLQLLGLVREHQDRLADAEALLRQSLVLRPNQPHVQVHLGRILAQAGRHQEAIDLLQAAAGHDLFDAFVVLAQVQLTVGDFAAAETNYRSALRLAPKSQVALLGLGVLLN
ncbi:MAG TPA: tetratricopeptide repeat protein, partial [Rhizomicrobium sp.]|nr:tetratricopeptide repeat protein [Rhizomicrobium sp.]